MSDLSSEPSVVAPALTIIYPPTSVGLPIESPVQVWVFYGDSGGQGLGNQPIQFTPGQYTIVLSADAATDADGYAHAVIKLSRPGALGTNSVFVGSVTAAITNGPSISTSLYAFAAAGGPGKIEIENRRFTEPPYDGLAILPEHNLMRLRYTLADGKGAICPKLICTPTDPSLQAYFQYDVAFGDVYGTAWNPASVKQRNSDWGTPFDAHFKAQAPNVIAQNSDTGTYPPSQLWHIGIIGGAPQILKIGPADDMAKRLLPNGEPVLFKAVFLSPDGVPLQGKEVQIAVRCEGNYTLSPPSVTDENGETGFFITVPDNGRAVLIRASSMLREEHYGYYGDRLWVGYTEGCWAGLFYDETNPPFVNESVRITPPGTRQTIGVGAEYKVMIRGNQPVNNQTVYWEASPPDRIIFSPLTGPLNTVPGTRFPTVTDSQGNSSIRVSAIGSTAFFGTIRAKVPNRETGTYFSNEVAVGFRPPA
ncbi:hypothetical protein [Brucella sp. IR073]|uniref:hypothetical protein n=1 Tax=unclassified Brucella TaxID=2632610 RepID=UPI003B986E02